jgi:hypothetical protein
LSNARLHGFYVEKFFEENFVGKFYVENSVHKLFEPGGNVLEDEGTLLISNLLPIVVGLKK